MNQPASKQERIAAGTLALMLSVVAIWLLATSHEQQREAVRRLFPSTFFGTSQLTLCVAQDANGHVTSAGACPYASKKTTQTLYK